MHGRKTNLLASIGAVLAVGGGGWLTFRGIASIPDGASPISEHLPLLGILFGALLVAAIATTRWLRLPVSGITLLLAAGGAVAFGHALSLVTVAWIALAASCLGRLLLPRRLDAQHIDLLMVGIAAYGTAIGSLAHLPMHYRGTIAGLLLLPILLAPRHARSTIRSAFGTLTQPREYGLWGSTLHAAIGACALLLLLVAMMPERGHDGLATHLLVPEYVRWHQHWPFDVERYVWAVMPMLVDWVYTLGVVIDGEGAAKLTNLAGVLLVARLVHDLARWAGANPTGALLASLVFVSTPLTLCETSGLFIDSIWSALLLGGALACLRLTTGGDGANRNLVLAGALLGAAAAAKAVTFMALPVLALGLALTIRRWLRGSALGGLAAGTALFAGFGCVPYVRAWLLTGNPVFPFFNGVFQSDLYPKEDFQPPVQFEKGMDWDVLYRITFDAGHYIEGMAGSGGFQWLLAVAPAFLVFALSLRWRGLALVAICAAIAFLTFRQTAYLRYVLPSFAMAAAAVGAWAAQPQAVARLAAWVAALAAVGLNVTFYSSASFHDQVEWRVLANEAARSSYLEDHMPMRRVVQVLNGLNPTGNDVAFFAPPVIAGLRSEGLFPNWYNHRFDAEVAGADSPEAIGALLGSRHVRYVVLDDTWNEEARRALVRGATRRVRRIAHLDIRELQDPYRAPTERLQAPRFGTSSSWYAPKGVAFENGKASLTAGAICNQTVSVVPEREHRLSVTVDTETTSGEGQLLLIWTDRRGRFVHQQTIPLDKAAGTTSVEVIAPRRARQAVLSATCRTGTVVLREISLRH